MIYIYIHAIDILYDSHICIYMIAIYDISIYIYIYDIYIYMPDIYIYTYIVYIDTSFDSQFR